MKKRSKNQTPQKRIQQKKHIKKEILSLMRQLDQVTSTKAKRRLVRRKASAQNMSSWKKNYQPQAAKVIPIKKPVSTGYEHYPFLDELLK